MENGKITFSSGGRTAEITSKDLSQLARTLHKNEYNLNCPKCHGKDFRRWVWLKRVMHKCNKCGRIWSY